MLVEVLVFGCEERVDDEFRNRLDRQIQTTLLGIFAEQRAVGRVDAGHHRRLVILKLRIVRQVFGKMPDQPCGSGDAHQEHHGSGGEQETHEPHQQAHQRISVSTRAPLYPAFSLSANPAAERSAVPHRRIIRWPRGILIDSEHPAVVFIGPPLWPN